MSILIGGDLVPYARVESLFISNDIERLLGSDLFEIWKKADYRFFNLECPITESNKTITKCGPCLKCSPSTINGIKGMLPSCLFLANNHIMDYSSKGLEDTIRKLDENGVFWVGVGKNNNSLKKEFVCNCDGKKVGIYNCCEHEFSVASKNEPGSNPYDEFSIDDDIKALKCGMDYVIVVYHGGCEHYRYPSPILQKRCRKMIDFGANLVICQHSHCVGCEEKYNGGTIIYGQGNFIFNMQQNEYWDNSLLIELDFNDGEPRLSYIPIVQTDCGTRLADKEEGSRILEGYEKRSEKIKQEGFVENEYMKHAREKLPGYLLRMKSSFWIRIARKFKPDMLTNSIFNCEKILNSIDCEAHRELFICGLKDNLRNKEKNG